VVTAVPHAHDVLRATGTFNAPKRSYPFYQVHVGEWLSWGSGDGWGWLETLHHHLAHADDALGEPVLVFGPLRFIENVDRLMVHELCAFDAVDFVPRKW
jgi:hypothetical protein